MRVLLLGLVFIPFISQAQVSELIPAITKNDTYLSERFTTGETDDQLVYEWTHRYLYQICSYDKCSDDQKSRLQKKIFSIMRKTWEYGIEEEAKRLNEIHDTISQCAPEANKVFAGEGNTTCAQLVKCEGESAVKLMKLVEVFGNNGSFNRVLDKEELEFEGLDLSSLITRDQPVSGGHRMNLTNGIGTYRNKKGNSEKDGISTGINKLPGIVTIRSISCDRDRKMKGDGSVKSEKITCSSVIARNQSPEVIYGKSSGFFTQPVSAVKEECIPTKKKKK